MNLPSPLHRDVEWAEPASYGMSAAVLSCSAKSIQAEIPPIFGSQNALWAKYSQDTVQVAHSSHQETAQH